MPSLPSSLLMLGAATALAADAPLPEADAVPPDPAFECFHVNSAWGLVLAGSMVDRSGAIRRYRLRDGDTAPAAGPNAGVRRVAAAALRARFARGEPAGAVDPGVVAAKLSFAAAAADGAVTRADTGARDAGSSTCHAYLRDAAAGYRDVELGSDDAVSDTRVRNAAPEAQALLDWLKSIGVAQ